MNHMKSPLLIVWIFFFHFYGMYRFYTSIFPDSIQIKIKNILRQFCDHEC